MDALRDSIMFLEESTVSVSRENSRCEVSKILSCMAVVYVSCTGGLKNESGGNKNQIF